MCASYEVGQVSENKIAVHIAHKDRARTEKELDKQLAIENKVMCLQWTCKQLNYAHIFKLVRYIIA